jgi:vacuolar protein sorting-associated protein 26
MAQFFGFGGSSTVINIKLNGDDERPKGKLITQDPTSPMVGIYAGSDHVSGTAEVVVQPSKKVEHLGAKVELIGQIDLLFDKSNSIKFTTVVKEIESAGTIWQTKTYPFEFNVEKAYETYSGVNVRLRYFVRVTITRQYKSNIIKEQDIIVRNVTPAPAITETKTNEDGTVVPVAPPGIKMEVGIEECLHIEFEFDKQKYHLKMNHERPRLHACCAAGLIAALLSYTQNITGGEVKVLFTKFQIVREKIGICRFFLNWSGFDPIY